MGQEKEAQTVREEQARNHARKCEICGQPILAGRGVCPDCKAVTSKND
jgi:uncharacterized OB-fold protein